LRDACGCGTMTYKPETGTESVTALPRRRFHRLPQAEKCSGRAAACAVEFRSTGCRGPKSAKCSGRAAACAVEFRRAQAAWMRVVVLLLCPVLWNSTARLAPPTYITRRRARVPSTSKMDKREIFFIAALAFQHLRCVLRRAVARHLLLHPVDFHTIHARTPS
jgi:hypothetical protein